MCFARQFVDVSAKLVHDKTVVPNCALNDDSKPTWIKDKPAQINTDWEDDFLNASSKDSDQPR